MESNNNKPLIRIIDDDAGVRSSWSFLLSGENYECVEFSDADTFFSANDFRRPGCILLDVRMPNMSGLELQNKLKEIGCDLPIVFVSGHADIDMAVNAVKNGAFDFLEKPAKESRLIDVIEAAVARNKANRRDQAEVADFKARLEQLTQRERVIPIKKSLQNSAFRKKPFRFTAAAPTASLNSITLLKLHASSCSRATRSEH